MKDGKGEKLWTLGGAQHWVHTGGCTPSADTVWAARRANGAATRLPREEMEHMGTLVKDGASTPVIKYVDLC